MPVPLLKRWAAAAAHWKRWMAATACGLSSWHNLMSLYGKLNLPVVGMAIRPGYAYIDNYTGSINEANTILQDYEVFGKWFPGLGTDIGLNFNLLNGNRVGFSYRWDYLSTGHKGANRFDNAFHSFNVNLMFNIN